MKKNKGITLMVLIITIIIMLILVAVTIDVVIDGKLFDTAKDAVEQTNDKVGQTQNRVDELMGELNNITEEETYEVEIANFRQSKINLNNMIGLLETAYESMSVSIDILHDLHILTTTISNPTYSPDEISAMIPEINNSLEEIDRIANETVFNDMYIINGSISGDNACVVNIITRQLTLEIDGVRRQDLGLEQIGDLTTEEGRNELLQKISAAIVKVNIGRSKLGATQQLYDYLIDYYESAEEILSQNLSIDITRDKLAINGMNKIVLILERIKLLEEQAMNGTMTSEEKESILLVINETMLAIDVIAEDLEFKGQKLLNGSYKNIPNLNTVGLSQNGEEFYVDLSTQDSITKSINECENAVTLIENVLKQM